MMDVKHLRHERSQASFTSHCGKLLSGGLLDRVPISTMEFVTISQTDLFLNFHPQNLHCADTVPTARVAVTTVVALQLIVGSCSCQIQAGVYDFGLNRWGERRGSWTPGEWLAAILLVMTILLGLAVSIGLCYYVNRNQAQKAASRRNFLRRQNLQMGLSVQQASEESKRQTPSSGRQSSLSFERAHHFERARGGGELVDHSTAYRDHYNTDQRQQRQTPDASLVVQL